jgi:hypothetical protein
MNDTMSQASTEATETAQTAELARTEDGAEGMWVALAESAELVLAAGETKTAQTTEFAAADSARISPPGRRGRGRRGRGRHAAPRTRYRLRRQIASYRWRR